MHELAIAQQMIETIQQATRGEPVVRVTQATLEIGVLSGAEPESLQFAFEVAGRNTVVEGCQLVVRRLPAVVACEACGYEGSGEPFLSGCPSCGAPGMRLVSGRELRLVSIEVEDS